MEIFEFFSYLPQVIGGIANLLIFGATIYAVVTRPSLATGLMVAGAFAREVSSLFFSLGIWYFESDYERYAAIAAPFQIIAFAGAVAFIVGFFLLVYRLFSAPANV